ncbi:MAG: type II toxin-antitoxin system PemK/MazF family toxin [Rhodospirillaceae bacterium]|nr:type II toxin-antitoxin system PemK/MazF family toxin [Rhodospirillaceae bacterium]
MTYEPFDVVVVPFPFTDRRASKRRPALIVSSASFNEAHEQAVLTMITTTAIEWPSDVALGDWQEAGLNAPCKVRFKLFTLDDTLIVRRLGTLSKQDGAAVTDALRRFLAVD